MFNEKYFAKLSAITSIKIIVYLLHGTWENLRKTRKLWNSTEFVYLERKLELIIPIDIV